MKPLSKRIETFHDRYPLVGPAFWIASVQFFITMIVVAMSWPTHYSALNNTISDLGNTTCGVYNGRYVCSPDNVWINISFRILGITMALGSILIYQEFKKTRASRLGFTFMALAGVGTIMVGLFAENTASGLHEVGAALPFVLGNLGLLVLGFALDIPRWLKIFTITVGAISLTAFLLFATHHYLGLGIGGMERLAAHPQTLWMIIFGLYLCREHYSVLPA